MTARWSTGWRSPGREQTRAIPCCGTRLVRTSSRVIPRHEVSMSVELAPGPTSSAKRARRDGDTLGKTHEHPPPRQRDHAGEQDADRRDAEQVPPGRMREERAAGAR